MPEALELLKTRTSPKAQDLIEPAPNDSQLNEILTIAARVPDHGMMKPWRFVVLPKATRGPIVDKITANFRAGNPNASDAEVEISPNPKVPDVEQLLSAGAACMNLLNAAHALGFAANWLTGWAAFDKSSGAVFGLAANEQIVGFIHIGTAKGELFQRPRPDMAQIVSRL